ncbi:uncharacterized protein METZ01_LOCUS259938, partial [marine metagenome]
VPLGVGDVRLAPDLVELAGHAAPLDRGALFIDGDAPDFQQRKRAGVRRVFPSQKLLAIVVAIGVRIGVGVRLGAGKNSELFPLPAIVQAVEVMILL